MAKQLLVEQRAVALDVAGLLEGAHPPQAGRRRDADPAGKFHIGDSAVVLEFPQDIAVDGVEAGRHGKPPGGEGDALSPLKNLRESPVM
jgi:hypothetical protein